MSRDCCSWDGVICDEMTGHVVELDLSCSQLVGNIDSNSSLFQLSRLQRLNLSRNTFSNSHISPLFGRLSSLTHLDLSYTSFSGQIPSEISHLSKLQSLHLLNYDIQLGPHNFKILLQNLTQLRLLDLRLVNISSTIPPKFSSHLTTLRLGDTDLYGIIPERIFHLSNLKELDLSYNDHLTGYFPTTKWNSTASIEELYLSQVDFSGSFLPESIGYLTSLRYVMLNSCNLSGKIPKSLWNLTRLEHLDLKDNLLEGSIPLFTSGLQNLSYLRLLNNLLNGVIPSWKFSLPSLSKLDLKDNHFCGQLEDFRYNSILTHIDLGHNQLQGYLSESIQKLVNLASIHFEHNQFQGPLPKSLQNLVNLTWLDLSSNNFSGNVDVSIFSNLKQLFLLELSHNSISLTNENNVNSTLPESVESLGLSGCEIRELDFLRSAKQLSNKQKATLQTSLLVLDLARNNLKGAIPRSLGSMSDDLKVLDMQRNSLSGNLQIGFGFGNGLKSLNLHGNKLAGKIPRSLANCKELEVLDLQNKNLNDAFPMWLGTLPYLQVLSLRSNKLHGPITTSGIKNLFPQLRILDLSSYAFTSELPTRHIPSVMGDLISLRVLNLSYNGFQGCIPRGPQLGTFGINSYEGNDGLRGFPVSKDCGSSWRPETKNAAHALDKESNSSFLSELSWKVVLMGYGSGLCIGFSIEYVMLSSPNPNWLSRIAEDLEYRIIMRRRKKKRGQMHYRRRKNGV
ncbi:hypothetical protein BC332_12861 [Capsicum chinense]|nr:hypothetical protein BC332_12861 [Capsicum chinense]